MMADVPVFGICHLNYLVIQKDPSVRVTKFALSQQEIRDTLGHFIADGRRARPVLWERIAL